MPIDALLPQACFTLLAFPAKDEPNSTHTQQRQRARLGNYFEDFDRQRPIWVLPWRHFQIGSSCLIGLTRKLPVGSSDATAASPELLRLQAL